MDIILTHGYFLNEDANELKIMKPYPPLGILYLSSYLKSKGFKVDIFDSTFRSKQEFYEYIGKNNPPIVGIYCNLMTKQNVLEMMRYCKSTGTRVILGGPEPPHYAEEYLKRGADIVVAGEGELTLEEVLHKIPQKGWHKLHEIQGIIFLDENKQIIKTAPRPLFKHLDELPFPDRTAIDIPEYVDTWKNHHGLGAVSLISARGCPYTCTWCSHSVYGMTHRRRSPQNVADEVDLLISEYSPDMLWYADDVFTIHPTWFFNYAAELKNRNIKIPFECISREDRLNEEIIKALAEMGCFRLWIGSESGSQGILDAMKRKTNAARVQEMTQLLRKYGIQAGMFIMLGYEGETVADLEETVDHLKKGNPDLFLTTVSYPIKGTPYYDQVSDRISANGNWESITDRDLVINGRHSKRYYSYANRWMVNEVALHKQINNDGRNVLKMVKYFANSSLGRLGMALTNREVEGS